VQHGGNGIDRGCFSSRHWFNTQHHSRSLKAGLAWHGSCLFRSDGRLSRASQPHLELESDTGASWPWLPPHSITPFCSWVVFLGPSACWFIRGANVLQMAGHLTLMVCMPRTPDKYRPLQLHNLSNKQRLSSLRARGAPGTETPLPRVWMDASLLIFTVFYFWWLPAVLTEWVTQWGLVALEVLQVQHDLSVVLTATGVRAKVLPS